MNSRSTLLPTTVAVSKHRDSAMSMTLATSSARATKPAERSRPATAMTINEAFHFNEAQSILLQRSFVVLENRNSK
eukprot:scaffold148596_cov46-Prasinocladus_malaysianus.AAC.1